MKVTFLCILLITILSVALGCQSGFEEKNGRCIDINECRTGNGGCDKLTKCTNLAGSFQCGPCPKGYDGNGRQGCSDKNECQWHGGCDPLVTCTNTPGSFRCGKCPPGYKGSGTTKCVSIAKKLR